MARPPAAKSTFRDRFPRRNSASVRALSRNVLRLRRARRWNQAELADAAGIEQGAVSLIESGRANPTLLVLDQIAKALGVATVELLDARRGERARRTPAV